MSGGRLRRRLWETARRVHSDIRVAAFLRALSVVGMILGFAGFLVGLNPFVAVLVPTLTVEGSVLLKIGITGLFVYSGSLLYYTATSTVMLGEDGALRL